ncbi:MAG: OsmC family protein [Candidatus Aminicenantes bacterium]|nr:OsmC family protein [Candidatus Aminicenantes bacterium]MCK4759510.1 OsmC family protein [Candidatus Aminicenantes bacterium]
MEREMKVTFPGGTRVDAEYKGRVIETDQPIYYGGGGTAPAPFDLFLASIATCCGFYVLAFCQKRGVPPEKASLVMKTVRNPESKMIEKLLIDIQLPPEFPEKYKKAVIKAVDTCSVKAHIVEPPAFELKAKIG